jgi:hypothetical protein
MKKPLLTQARHTGGGGTVARHISTASQREEAEER